MPSSPRGAPLGLLIRPYEPAKHGRDGDSGDRESWQWLPPGRPPRWRRLGAAAKLVVLVVTLAGGLAGSVMVGAGGLWWWLAHLASAGPHH